MTIDLKLLASEPAKSTGFPLVFMISHKGRRKKFMIGRCLPEQFLHSEGSISRKHPEYDLLMPEIAACRVKAREIIAKRIDDVELAYNILFGGAPAVKGTFKEMGDAIAEEYRAAANVYEKSKDFTNANKNTGNARVYENALGLFHAFAPGVQVAEIDFRLVWRYREACLKKGNSRSTVHVYLRTLRAIYNKLVKLHGLEDRRPFDGVFAGLKVKSHSVRKKHAGKATVRQIEGIEHRHASMGRWTDLWLLQFYLGGADLIDVYYLKHSQLRKGRVYFTRGKLNTSTVIDLAVHPKAQAIIDRYKADGEYVFPWRKDPDGYKTFRRAMYARLGVVQKRHGIELEGMGGALAPKAARHTFANIAKLEGIEEDLLRELMGHERDDVDNYYKDKYPQAVRDAALFRIID